MDHSVVQKWLRSVLHPYQDSSRVFADVDRTLVAISSLSPKTEVFTYDDGRTQLLLLLSGTIPIQYRSATYNIPLEIWVPRPYPREAPYIYVRPTNEMLVRKGKNVDISGRVGADYLQQWQRKWESCNLLDCLRVCQDVFGQEPPVYAKPKAKAVTTSPIASGSRQSSEVMQRQPPAIPSQNLSQSTPSPGPSQQLRETAPLRPPKPGGSSVSDRDSRSTSISSTTPGWPVSPRHSNGSNFTSPRQPTRLQTWEADGRSHAYSPADRSQRSSSLQTQPTATPPPPPSSSSHPQLPATFTHPAVPPTPPQLRQTYITSPAQSIDNQNVAAAAPPPRPPNPELLHLHAVLHHKIQSRVHFLQSTISSSHQQLHLLNNDLDRGYPAIQDEMARLEAVRDVCRATGDGLEEAVSVARARTDELNSRAEPDVDGMICATSIVGNQLIDLVAEDSAIGDTLFYLGQALNSEIIDTERFLKQTRFLAREQFMRRALAQKITYGMGCLQILNRIRAAD